VADHDHPAVTGLTRQHEGGIVALCGIAERFLWKPGLAVPARIDRERANPGHRADQWFPALRRVGEAVQEGDLGRRLIGPVPRQMGRPASYAEHGCGQ
jgi:hypothetical protein